MKFSLFAVLVWLLGLFVSSDSLAQTYVNQIFITNFKIDNNETNFYSSPARFVTYTMTLSKPSGYHGYATVYIVLGNSSGATITTSSILAARGLPPNMATLRDDGWEPGNNGRDYYTITETRPAVQDPQHAGFNTSDPDISNTAYTRVYALIQNGGDMNWADPYALRGMSHGLYIVRPPDCTRDLLLQNEFISGRYYSGNSIIVGSRVDSRRAYGPVNNDGAALRAVESVKFENEFFAAEGVGFEARIDPSACDYITGAQEGPSEASIAATATTQQAKELEVYPNPVSDEMTVILPEYGNVREARIYNNYGTEVKRFKLQAGQTKVDVRKLQPGIYYIHTSAGKVVTKTRFQVAR